MVPKSVRNTHYVKIRDVSAMQIMSRISEVCISILRDNQQFSMIFVW